MGQEALHRHLGTGIGTDAGTGSGPGSGIERDGTERVGTGGEHDAPPEHDTDGERDDARERNGTPARLTEPPKRRRVAVYYRFSPPIVKTTPIDRVLCCFMSRATSDVLYRYSPVPERGRPDPTGQKAAKRI